MPVFQVQVLPFPHSESGKTSFSSLKNQALYASDTRYPGTQPPLNFSWHANSSMLPNINKLQDQLGSPRGVVTKLPLRAVFFGGRWPIFIIASPSRNATGKSSQKDEFRCSMFHGCSLRNHRQWLWRTQAGSAGI